MIYFKHMSNMRHDIKIKRLISKYGIEGYGLYNLILESIVENITTDNPLPELQETCVDIAEFYNIDTYKAEEIVNFCIGQGLFEQDELTGKIVCSKIYKFLEQSQTRSKEIRKLITEYKSYSEKVDFVYVMKNGENYKIGKSLCPERRLYDVRNSIPGDTFLIMKKESEYGYKLENELHKLFADKKVKNEWFSLDKNDLELLVKQYGFSVYDTQETKVIEENRIEENRIDKEEKKKFIPPTKEEADAYCKQENLNVDTFKFIKYYAAADWKIKDGKKMKNWKQALARWHIPTPEQERRLKARETAADIDLLYKK